jgi:hypothetical protein
MLTVIQLDLSVPPNNRLKEKIAPLLTACSAIESPKKLRIACQVIGQTSFN